MPTELPFSDQNNLREFVEGARKNDEKNVSHSLVWVYAKMIADDSANVLRDLDKKSQRGDVNTLDPASSQLGLNAIRALRDIILGNFIMTVEEMLIDGKYRHGVFTRTLNNYLTGVSIKERAAPVEDGDFDIDYDIRLKMLSAAREDLTLSIFAQEPELIPPKLRDYLSGKRFGGSDALQMLKEDANAFKEAAVVLVNKT